MAAIDGPDQYSFGAQGVWGPVEKRMLDAMGALGARTRTTRRSGAAASGDRASPTACAASCCRSARRQSGITSAGSLSGRRDDQFPHRPAGLAAMIAAGLPLRCVALEAPGSYDTHAGQASGL